MKLLALTLAAFLSLLSADVTGKFMGTWTSGSTGNSGALEMSFTPAANGEFTATSSFSYQGQPVKTSPMSVRISGDQVEVVFAYDVGDAKLHSTMKGTLTGESIKGRYVSQDAAGQPVDEGAWEVTRK